VWRELARPYLDGAALGIEDVVFVPFIGLRHAGFSGMPLIVRIGKLVSKLVKARQVACYPGRLRDACDLIFGNSVGFFMRGTAMPRWILV